LEDFMRYPGSQTVVVAAVLLLTTTAPLVAQEDKLEKCATPIGTLAVVEPEAETLSALGNFGLSTPTSLIRMMVQHSGCFTVVERGAGLSAMQRERALANSGELQQGANVGPGQMVAADFLLTPNVIFSEGNAGGVGGAVGGVLGRRRGVLGGVGAVAGGLKFKEAHTSMLVGDVRSGVQVAAADGHAKKTDFRIGVLGFAGGAAGAVGGYTNTNEGKVIAASFLDNYNAIVRAMRRD
jgi:curli biogenesis system outer membrane secretion channel CsgG